MEGQKMSILLKNALYLKPDCRTWTTDNIFLDEGRIKAIGADCSNYTADETINCTGKAIIPGLINAHAHSYTGYLKGTIDNVPLDIYMLYAIAGGSFRNEREIYICSLVEALQMLKRGTTSVIDHFSQRPSISLMGLDADAAAFKKLGLRTRIATMFADKGFFDTLPLEPGELPGNLLPKSNGKAMSIDEYLTEVEKAYLKYRDDALVDIILGTDGPQRCSDELLLKHAELENKYKMGWETHILEAKTQAIVSNRFYRKGLIEHMDELGVLNERTALVHHVWVSDAELDCVKRANATVVHCPSSNLHLGSGIAPVDLYKKRGIDVALGSDGGNCGNLSMFDQIKLTALLHNVSNVDYEEWFSASDALMMDYRGGAKLFGKKIGCIELGACADICIIDTDNILWQPVNDMTRQLVYYENGANVDTVIVNGCKVLENGKSLFVDEAELICEANELCAKLRRDCADAMKLVEKQIPYMRRMYLREMQRNIGFTRFARN